MSRFVLAVQGDSEAIRWSDDLLRLVREKNDEHELTRALVLRGYVFLELKRYPEAFQVLQEVESRPESPSYYDGAFTLRARLLWATGKRSEALAGLRKRIADLLHREDDGKALIDLEQLGQLEGEASQSVRPDFSAAMDHYRSRGEAGRQSSELLLETWLVHLTKNKEWDEGSQVLHQYPWTAPANGRATVRLRKYAAWADLLPAVPKPPESSVPVSLITLVDQLRLAHPELGQLMTLRSTNLSRLQARLAPHETLVTYCSLGDQLYLLALRPDGGFWRTTAIDSQRLKSLVSSYVSSLGKAQLAQRSEVEQTLYDALLGPVLSEGPGQRLLLVPSPELWELPFGALRDEHGHPVASRTGLALLTSGDLLRLADSVWKPYRLSHPLAIGAPPQADLPAAAQELDEVAHILPGCQLSSGKNATLEVLFQPGQRWGLLHFATHAHYHSDRPTESDIMLSDGSLKLNQLPSLSIGDHALVALSCCQGGASSGQQLEDPVTLATGFSAVGAETVIGNLWTVDDNVARDFFRSFYRRLVTGATPMESFRSAQDHCRHTHPDPRAWAGFFLLGNPQ